MTDEKEYGSLGRLAPEWDGDERERNLTADDIYERFFGWVEDVKGIEPWPHQEEAIMDLLAGDHVILNTPTGSGKSLVALGMHFAALCTGRRSYYTAPIKALVSEKFFDLVEVFGRDNVGMITGDSHINADAPIICCTAEILANQALREGTHADVGLVAMDEFHYYGDSERGWAWQVPLLTLPNTQFLLMSATLGNVDAIADKLEDMTDTDVDIIADAPRPVPLTYEYTLDPLEKTVELARAPKEVAETKVAEEAKAPAEKPQDAVSGAEAEVKKTLLGWANAWSRKDVRAYLGYYASDFQTPKGASRKAWEAERASRIDKPGKLQVTVDDVRVSIANDKATVKFRHGYVSSSLKSSTSKTLIFVKSGSKWLIQQERVG